MDFGINWSGVQFSKSGRLGQAALLVVFLIPRGTASQTATKGLWPQDKALAVWEVVDRLVWKMLRFYVLFYFDVNIDWENGLRFERNKIRSVCWFSLLCGEIISTNILLEVLRLRGERLHRSPQKGFGRRTEHWRDGELWTDWLGKCFAFIVWSFYFIGGRHQAKVLMPSRRTNCFAVISPTKSHKMVRLGKAVVFP